MDVLKKQTEILLEQMTDNNVSYAMKTELLYKYLYDLAHNWTVQNTKTSFSEKKEQDIDINGAIECCFRHILHPEWNLQSDDSKNNLYSALKQMKDRYAVEDAALIEHLMEVCRHPWTSAVKDVLSGSKCSRNETFQALITQESLPVRLFRLETLLDSNLLKLAYNYGKFVIEAEILKNCSTEECKEVNARKDDFFLSKQIGMFIILAMKLKKLKEATTILLGLPRPTLHALILIRIKELDRNIGKEEHCEAFRLLCNCVFHLINEGNYPRLATINFIKQMFDTSAALFDEDHLRIMTDNCRDSTAIYVLANCTWKKYGKSKLRGILRLFNRGLNTDLNMAEILKAKLEQDKDKKEEAAETLRLLDGTMAEAYKDLAGVLKDKDIWYRECILTSFSLAPSHSLLNEIVKCAEGAGPSSPDENGAIAKTDSCGSGEEATDADNSFPSDSMASWDSFKSSIDMEKFDVYCQRLERSLRIPGFSRGYTKLKKDGTKPPADFMGSGSSLCEKTLDGLLSIEGSVLTASLTYDPLTDPMAVFGMDDIPSDLISDLLIVVNSPRWHLLSWVHPWKVLRERCQHLLKSPLNRESQDLKYLVIDYTQFDDWSSDEEFEIVTGIEPGYESWEELSDDDDDDEK